jgi:hypothetical protein
MHKLLLLLMEVSQCGPQKRASHLYDEHVASDSGFQPVIPDMKLILLLALACAPSWHKSRATVRISRSRCGGRSMWFWGTMLQEGM